MSTEEKLAALHGYNVNLLEEHQGLEIQDGQAVLGVNIYLCGEEKIRVKTLNYF